MNKQEAIDHVEKELREYFIDKASVGQSVSAGMASEKVNSILNDMVSKGVFVNHQKQD